MRGYSDGMQRLGPFACVLACAGLLALPAAADPPLGWQAGSGVQGSFSALRAGTGLGIAGGFSGAVAFTTDGGATWTTTSPPSDAQVRGVAATGPNALFALDGRGVLWRSHDAGVTWAQLQPAGGVHPVALDVVGGRLVVVARRSLLVSIDAGDSFASATPKLARADAFTGIKGRVVFGPHSLLVSATNGRSWQHLRLPPLTHGDSLLAADFPVARAGYVLSAFRRLYFTPDAGHHWTERLGTGGAGADLAFSDLTHGYLAAPGFANRFDDYVLYTNDAGGSWRPERVSPGFLSHVAASGATAYAIGNEGAGLFATRVGAEPGRRITVGFRPVPRIARLRARVTIRGRLTPNTRAPVVVSMRSSGRWLTRFHYASARGVFTARFVVQRNAWFVAQVLPGAGHGPAATKPVLVLV